VPEPVESVYKQSSFKYLLRADLFIENINIYVLGYFSSTSMFIIYFSNCFIYYAVLNIKLLLSLIVILLLLLYFFQHRC